MLLVNDQPLGKNNADLQLAICYGLLLFSITKCHNRLNFAPQVIGINSHVETLEDSLNGEVQKGRAASTGTNSERSATIPLELPPSRSTCPFLAGETTKESLKSPFNRIPPHSPAGNATHPDQQRARTSSDASEFCKGEDPNAQ